MTALAIDVHPARAWPALAATWTRLVDSCPHATFFVTTAWVETWLDHFGKLLDPAVLVFRDPGGTPVAACLLVRRTDLKGPFTIRRICLNTSGEADEDSPCIEFNTLVCVPGHERPVAHALREHLDELRRRDPWDEFAADGIADEQTRDALEEAFDGWHAADRVKPSYHIDLEQLRSSGRDFIETLTHKGRMHVRQNIRKLAQLGELRLESPATLPDALATLDELAALHQKTWNERGLPGSFASATFTAFHRDLITRCFERGEVQLLRLLAGDVTVGVVYNFVYRGKLYFYQSGYDYGIDKRLSPGVVVQAYAIRRAASLGLADYDLMAGGVDYKKRLASEHHDLHWLVWQAPSVKMRAFDLIQKARALV